MKINENERIGVAQIQMIVNRDLKWIFRELSIQDYGIDAHIEILGESYATGKILGVQIKCGLSYFKENDGENIIFRFSKKHFLYWSNYSLPVIIVLVNPDTLDVIWEVFSENNIIKINEESYKIKINLKNKFDKNARNKLLDLGQIKKEINLSNEVNDEENYFDMGYNYEFGINEYDVNYEQARYYYKKSADQGNKVAQFNYALLLLHGKGGSVDNSQAYYYLKKSALQNFVPAMYNLGLMFFHGRILYKQDIEEAKKWLEKANKNGDENSKVWVMYCELIEIISSIKTPNVETQTIPFIDSFENLVKKISVNDLHNTLKNNIKQSKIVFWTKGLFYMAEQATENAKKQGSLDGEKFWYDCQKILLLFELLGSYFNYDFESLVLKTDYSCLEKAWNDQLNAESISIEYSLYNIACNEILHKTQYLDFWNHVIKCCDLLIRIEKLIAVKKSDNEISIELQQKACSNSKVCISNISYYINDSWDIHIQGNIEAMDDYENIGKLIVKADLCDEIGRTLYTLREYGEIKLHLSGYDSFNLNCLNIIRFIEPEKIRKIRIYPVFE